MNTTLGQLLPVGSVIHSMLTESQFQSLMGSGWVLANGRSAAGSVYNSLTGAGIVPDMRGTFLRAKDNGVARNADGDLALGTYTDDKFESHNHSGSFVEGNPDTIGGGAPPNVTGTTGRYTYQSETYISPASVYGNHTVSYGVLPNGSNETSPKSTIVNIFFRMN